MEVAAGLIRLKEGQASGVSAWQTTLASRRSEVLRTLRKEGVYVESWFEVEIEGRSYLLWYMRAESIQRAPKVFESSVDEIDIFHREAIGAISDDLISARPLLDLSQSDLKG